MDIWDLGINWITNEFENLTKLNLNDEQRGRALSAKVSACSSIILFELPPLLAGDNIPGGDYYHGNVAITTVLEPLHYPGII